MNWTEWIGYAAAAFVVCSFLISNIKWLRSVNMMGAVLFVIYGILLDKNLPVIIPNVFIIGIQLYHLLLKKEK